MESAEKAGIGKNAGGDLNTGVNPTK